MYGEGQEAATSVEEAQFGKSRTGNPDIEGIDPSPYDVDPSDQIWWDEMVGEDERPSENYVEFFENVEVPGERFVEGNDGSISPDYAFDRGEMVEIESAVDEVYDRVSSFVEDVADSIIHPQQSKQIERWFDGETYKPTEFDSYDGFPKVS